MTTTNDPKSNELIYTTKGLTIIHNSVCKTSVHEFTKNLEHRGDLYLRINNNIKELIKIINSYETSPNFTTFDDISSNVAIDDLFTETDWGVEKYIDMIKSSFAALFEYVSNIGGKGELMALFGFTLLEYEKHMEYLSISCYTAKKYVVELQGIITLIKQQNILRKQCVDLLVNLHIKHITNKSGKEWQITDDTNRKTHHRFKFRFEELSLNEVRLEKFITDCMALIVHYRDIHEKYANILAQYKKLHNIEEKIPAVKSDEKVAIVNSEPVNSPTIPTTYDRNDYADEFHRLNIYINHIINQYTLVYGSHNVATALSAYWSYTYMMTHSENPVKMMKVTLSLLDNLLNQHEMQYTKYTIDGKLRTNIDIPSSFMFGQTVAPKLSKEIGGAQIQLAGVINKLIEKHLIS